jgi:hypothetical protein
MACSHCGGADHNIQTCPSVRRCSVCTERGHDRRNCPQIPEPPRASTAEPAVPTPSVAPPDRLFDHLRRLCSGQEALLAHLYWPEREHYYQESLRAHLDGSGWPLVATPGHGVGRPDRPTVNFLIADEAWVTAYASAAESRNIRHGLLLRRAAIEQLARRPGYQFAEVIVGHPQGHGVDDPGEFWKFDIGNHRFKALHEMRFATVARLATPELERERRLIIPSDAIVACW